MNAVDGGGCRIIFSRSEDIILNRGEYQRCVDRVPKMRLFSDRD